MKKLAVVLVAGMIISGAIAQTRPIASEKGKSRFIDVGKAALTNTLNDPPSARFKNIKLTETVISPNGVMDRAKSFRTLCGEFNAKNSYGGYGNYEKFFVDMTLSASVERVWTVPSMDNNFSKIDAEINSKFNAGEIGDLSKIRLTEESRIARIDEHKKELMRWEIRCDTKNNVAKVIWSQR